MPSPDIRPYTLSPLNQPMEYHLGGDGLWRFAPADMGFRRKRLAITGSQGTRMVPFDDPTVEVWGINNFWNTMRDSQDRLRADIWWEMHQIRPDLVGIERGTPIQDENDMRWINTCPVPLYTTEVWPANPRSARWPIGYFAKKYRDYFTCTFAMQIAEAIDIGFEELIVCGIELLCGTKRETTVESSCVNYWLGLAEGRGMKITIMDRPNGSHQFLLNHPYHYGHEYWPERRWVEQYVAQWDARPVAI